MPIIMRTNGAIPESFRNYLNNILGKHDIKETEKAAILGTARKLTFPMASSITGAINCNHRIAATVYTLFQVYNGKYHCLRTIINNNNKYCPMLI
jgi:hypothetical protein